MFRLCVTMLLLLGLLDPIFLLQIGWKFGFPTALGILILPGILGGRLARLQGYQCLQRVQGILGKGGTPSIEMLEGALLLATGLLLIYPGPLTTLAGVFLLIPFLRRLLARILIAGWKRSGTYEVRTDEEEHVVGGASIGIEDAPIGTGVGSAPNSGRRLGEIGPDGLKVVEGEDLGSEPISPDERPQLPSRENEE